MGDVLGGGGVVTGDVPPTGDYQQHRGQRLWDREHPSPRNQGPPELLHHGYLVRERLGLYSGRVLRHHGAMIRHSRVAHFHAVQQPPLLTWGGLRPRQW